MKKSRIYLVSFLALTGLAAACGGKGDELTGGDGDGDGDTGDGDTGDGDGDAGDGDGDAGDGDAGDGDAGDGDGDMTAGGAGGMGGLGAGGEVTGAGGDVGTGGLASAPPGCSGSALSCTGQSQVACVVAGCEIVVGCSGDAGCEELETAMLCNSATDELECMYGTVCSGTPIACADHEDSVSCESVGCTWTDN